MQELGSTSRHTQAVLIAAISSIELIGRIALAAVLGVAVGIERERRAKAAGIRTHSLVAMGSALFALVGAYGFSDVAADSDPTRVAAQIASGIGFIGAGAILRHGRGVVGLTTASTIWISAALGVGAAAGMYVLSTTAALVGLVVIMIGRQSGSMVRRRGRRTLSFTYQIGHGTLAPVLDAVEKVGVVGHVSVVDRIDGENKSVRTLTLEVDGTKPGDLETAVMQIMQRPEMIEVRWDDQSGPPEDEI